MENKENEKVAEELNEEFQSKGLNVKVYYLEIGQSESLGDYIASIIEEAFIEKMLNQFNEDDGLNAFRKLVDSEFNLTDEELDEIIKNLEPDVVEDIIKTIERVSNRCQTENCPLCPKVPEIIRRIRAIAKPKEPSNNE
ncbi:MAG: hypothetical protein WCQ49_01535 [Candidatus Saccharibacteria bacterium]